VRAIAWLIGFLIPLGVMTIALCPVPCEMQANLQPEPAADFIVDADTPAKAQANRLLLESKSGTVILPPGKLVFDQMPLLKSGTTLIGNGTSLTTQYTGGGFPLNCTLGGRGAGQGHVHPVEHRGRSQVWCASAVDCPPGTLVYLWVGTNSTPSPVRERRTVTHRDGNLLTLDSAIDRRCNVLKWFTDAAPIADAVEGADKVVTSRGQWQAGQSVLVTSGPQIANEATGELRTVIAVAGASVTVDRPLRRSYSLAALAHVQLVENVTLRDLTIDLPVNKQSESLYASLCSNWRIDRCRIAKVAIGNCAGLRFSDCDLGGVQTAASSHDLSFDRCRIQSIAFEEGCHDCTIDGCRIGPVSANMNCVSLRAQTERITIRDSSLLGGGWPSSQILMDGPGRECVFEELRMSGKTPCWLKGDRMRLSGVLSDGDISVTGADISRSQVWAANGRWGW
jgi:hypothetical protein